MVRYSNDAINERNALLVVVSDIASGYRDFTIDIYALRDLENPCLELITSRESLVDSICIHNDKICDITRDGKIYETVEKKCIFEVQMPDFTPQSHFVIHNHNGDLIAASSQTNNRGSEIRNMTKNIEMRRRNLPVISLASFQEKLYDGGGSGVYETESLVNLLAGIEIKKLLGIDNTLMALTNKGIYDVMTKRKISSRYSTSIAVNEEVVYDCTRSHVFDTLTNTLVAILPQNKIEGYSHTQQFKRLTSHNDKLIASTENILLEISCDKNPLCKEKTGTILVTAPEHIIEHIISVPVDMLRKAS